MTRNDPGVVVRPRGEFYRRRKSFRRFFPPGAGVDDRLKAVKKSIAHVNHVGPLEVNVDVRVGMRRLEILQHHDFTVGLQFLAVLKVCCGKASAGDAGKCKPKSALSCGSAMRVLVFSWAQHCGARGVQIGVIVGVVDMPVRVDHRLQRRIAQPIERFFQLRQARQKKRVDHDFAVGARSTPQRFPQARKATLDFPPAVASG